MATRVTGTTVTAGGGGAWTGGSSLQPSAASRASTDVAGDRTRTGPAYSPIPGGATLLLVTEGEPVAARVAAAPV